MRCRYGQSPSAKLQASWSNVPEPQKGSKRVILLFEGDDDNALKSIAAASVSRIGAFEM